MPHAKIKACLRVKKAASEESRIRNTFAHYKPEVVRIADVVVEVQPFNPAAGVDFVAFHRRQLEALCLQLGIPATVLTGG